jgi:hypothetical protein
MSAAPFRPPSPSSDIVFDGNVLDLDRVMASCAIAFSLHPSSFPSDSPKSAFLLAHFRGPALDWAARIIEKKPDSLVNYASFLNIVRSNFGYDAVQVQAIAQTQLGQMQQKGDVLEFLMEYDDACARAGAVSDITKVTMLLPKLNTFYRNAVVCSGDTISNYSTLRTQLLNIHSRMPAQGIPTETKRAKARCKKCGKRGHTATQCKSTN